MRVGDVPPPAVLAWYDAGADPAGGQAAAGSRVQDDTLGLRRSGIVRLPVPASWSSAPEYERCC